jgi:hypothetical protein
LLGRVQTTAGFALLLLLIGVVAVTATIPGARGDG